MSNARNPAEPRRLKRNKKSLDPAPLEVAAPLGRQRRLPTMPLFVEFVPPEPSADTVNALAALPLDADPIARVRRVFNYICYCISKGADDEFVETRIGIELGSLLGLVITHNDLVTRYAAAQVTKGNLYETVGNKLRADAVLAVHGLSGERFRAVRDHANGCSRMGEGFRRLGPDLIRRHVVSATSQEWLGERRERHAKIDAAKKSTTRLFRDYVPLMPAPAPDTEPAFDLARAQQSIIDRLAAEALAPPAGLPRPSGSVGARGST